MERWYYGVLCRVRDVDIFISGIGKDGVTWWTCGDGNGIWMMIMDCLFWFVMWISLQQELVKMESQCGHGEVMFVAELCFSSGSKCGNLCNWNRQDGASVWTWREGLLNE